MLEPRRATAWKLVITVQVYSRRQKKVYTCIKAKCSKSRGTSGKVRGAPHPSLRWSKLDQASYWNEAKPSLDHLNDGCGATPTFHLPPLSFEYSARQKCLLSFGGDCNAFLQTHAAFYTFLGSFRTGIFTCTIVLMSCHTDRAYNRSKMQYIF